MKTLSCSSPFKTVGIDKVRIVVRPEPSLHTVDRVLKALDTIGDSHRPAPSLGVPQHMHIVTNQ